MDKGAGMMEGMLGGEPLMSEEGGDAEGKALLEAVRSGNAGRLKSIIRMMVEDALDVDVGGDEGAEEY